MLSKGPIYREIQAQDELFLVGKIASWNSQRLLLKVSMLICLFPAGIFAEKVVKKVVWIEHKLQQQNTNTWPRKCNLRSCIVSMFCSFADLLISGQVFSLLYLFSKFNWHFLDDRGWTSSCTKYKIIFLWVSFLMHQESSNLDLCGLKNDQNTFYWSIPNFNFRQQNYTFVFWHFDNENDWMDFDVFISNIDLSLSSKMV